MVREIKFDNLDECCVCNSTKLEILLDLPRLPHIGIYLNPNDDQSAYPPIDNTLMYCHSCGHIQLGRAIDPSFLYTSDFQHKTSESSSAKQANNFLFKFTKEILKARPPELVAEIGCNDTFFLSKFVDNYKSTVIGVDPILKGKEDLFISSISNENKNFFKVSGKFIEEIDFKEEFGKSPDLIITNFVFEHLKNPSSVVKAMLKSMSDSGIGIIGVPSAEFMVLNARYDQLSHQHYQQFSIKTLHLLIERCGGEVIEHKVNFTNWGQVVIAFKKSNNAIDISQNFEKLSINYILSSIDKFKKDIINFKDKCDLLITTNKNILGFGAAQNFPIFHYFCDGEVPFQIIIDDHPLRQNKVFPYVSNISTSKPNLNYQGEIGVLTGPDYARVLFSRMGALEFDHIISPFSSY